MGSRREKYLSLLDQARAARLFGETFDTFDLANALHVAEPDRDGRAIVLFASSRLTQFLPLEQWFQYCILKLDEVVEEPYIFVYKIDDTPSGESRRMERFEFMVKSVKQNLDRRYSKNLHGMYIIDPSGSLEMFCNMIYPFISDKMRTKLNFVANCDQLAMSLGVGPSQFNFFIEPTRHFCFELYFSTTYGTWDDVAPGIAEALQVNLRDIECTDKHVPDPLKVAVEVTPPEGLILSHRTQVVTFKETVLTGSCEITLKSGGKLLISKMTEILNVKRDVDEKSLLADLDEGMNAPYSVCCVMSLACGELGGNSVPALKIGRLAKDILDKEGTAGLTSYLEENPHSARRIQDEMNGEALFGSEKQEHTNGSSAEHAPEQEKEVASGLAGLWYPDLESLAGELKVSLSAGTQLVVAKVELVLGHCDTENEKCVMSAVMCERLKTLAEKVQNDKLKVVGMDIACISDVAIRQRAEVIRDALVAIQKCVRSFLARKRVEFLRQGVVWMLHEQNQKFVLTVSLELSSRGDWNKETEKAVLDALCEDLAIRRHHCKVTDRCVRSVKAILTIEVLVTQEMNEIVNQGIEALRRATTSSQCNSQLDPPVMGNMRVSNLESKGPNKTSEELWPSDDEDDSTDEELPENLRELQEGLHGGESPAPPEQLVQVSRPRPNYGPPADWEQQMAAWKDPGVTNKTEDERGLLGSVAGDLFGGLKDAGGSLMSIIPGHKEAGDPLEPPPHDNNDESESEDADAAFSDEGVLGSVTSSAGGLTDSLSAGLNKMADGLVGRLLDDDEDKPKPKPKIVNNEI